MYVCFFRPCGCLSVHLPPWKGSQRSERQGGCLKEQEHKPRCVFKPSVLNKMASKLVPQTKNTWKDIRWVFVKVPRFILPPFESYLFTCLHTTQLLEADQLTLVTGLQPWHACFTHKTVPRHGNIKIHFIEVIGVGLAMEPVGAINNDESLAV